MNIAIFICLYFIAGYLTAEALSGAYDKSKWWLSWLIVYGWPICVVFATVGMLIELAQWAYKKLSRKEVGDNRLG
jgi:hypothetical protein